MKKAELPKTDEISDQLLNEYQSRLNNQELSITNDFK